MSYKIRVAFLIVIDSIIVFSSMYAGYIIMYAQDFMSNPLLMFKSGNILLTSVSLLISHHIFAYHYRLYDKAWEYASVSELISIVKAETLAVISAATIVKIVTNDIYFRTLFVVWMAFLILIGGSRFIWRITRDHYTANPKAMKRALILGAGSAGSTLVKQLQQHPESGLKPIAFLDDDVKKNRLEIHGLTVFGAIQNVKDTVEKMGIEVIVIAIPSLDKSRLREIHLECAKSHTKVLIMPKLEDVMLGQVGSNHFRDVEVEDLLGRDEIKLDLECISEKVTGNTVLITGAGGSIGSEICRQICQFKPSKLVLLGHGENSIYLIDMELKNAFGDSIKIIPVIADVQDRERIFEVFERYSPDVVYHAAAHKHVPLMECNPKEAIKNNVIGTRNVAEASDYFKVKTFVMVSTDKAVNPTNVMGSTKRIAEMIVQQMAQKSSTRFVCVRFGNVLGSRGSVIPHFKKQIKAGGPVTVTHPDITRFFMTIPEAARLVIQASALARGGEIFVLDMGEPVRIVDLAENLIHLSGYTVEEIGIEFTGLRPGEKMYEELLNDSEVHKEAIFPKILIGKTSLINSEKINPLIDRYLSMSNEEVRDAVIEIANPIKEVARQV